MKVSRRHLLGTGAAALAAPMILSAAPRVALAQSTAPRFQGVQRRRIGDVTVHALSDGFLQLDQSVFPAVDGEQFAEAHRADFTTTEAVNTAVNAYLIEAGDELILVDSGAGVLFGETLGRLPQALAAAGVDPAAIGHIFVTHLHGDHVGGLTQDGAAVFPNARMIVHQADVDFWLNPDVRASAPDGMDPFFAMAVNSAAPYQEAMHVVSGQQADILPGLTAIHLPGHTPGHMGLHIESGDQRLLIWADIIHNQALQFADPSITLSFDVDQEQAAATRAQVMDMVATDRLLVAGSHLDFPSFGHVDALSTGYRLIPARFPYTD